MQLLWSGSDFDIFFVGSRSDRTRAVLFSVKTGIGIGNVFPNRALNVLAI